MVWETPRPCCDEYESSGLQHKLHGINHNPPIMYMLKQLRGYHNIKPINTKDVDNELGRRDNINEEPRLKVNTNIQPWL